MSHLYHEPYEELRQSTSDARIVGLLFIVLGVVPMIPMITGPRTVGIVGRVVAVADTLILIGPGVWYVMAAAMMRRLNRQAATISLRVAAAQFVLIPLFLLVGSFWSEGWALWLPALLSVFFVPALVALCFSFRRIRRAMNLIEPDGHAFEALPVAAISEAEAQALAIAPPRLGEPVSPAQAIVIERAK